MKYFSLFSGIGGYEIGIEKASKSIRPTEQEVEKGRNRGNIVRRGTEKNEQRVSCVDRPIQQSNTKRPKKHNSIENKFRRWKCVGFSETNKYAIQVYQKHFPKHKNYGDATKIKPEKLPNFDMLCAGFPCQSFSIAGKRKGFQDIRGTLFFEICRIAQAKRPRILFLENVKGLLSHDEGRTFATILVSLDELGYDVEWQILNSKDFGVPQNRERVFVIGHLRGAGGQTIFPLREGIEISREERQGQQIKGEGVCSTIDSRYGALRNAGETYIQSNPHGFNYGGKRKFPNMRLSSIQNEFVNGIRRLTPVECERLQGFPDGWTKDIKDTQRYKCLGNAVTTNVIEVIVRNILDVY